jgi:hypothetical protein
MSTGAFHTLQLFLLLDHLDPFGFHLECDHILDSFDGILCHGLAEVRLPGSNKSTAERYSRDSDPPSRLHHTDISLGPAPKFPRGSLIHHDMFDRLRLSGDASLRA